MARYEALKEPMVARKQKLADSLRLQQLFRDVEDEETWIREKEPIAASTNRGRSGPADQFRQEPCWPRGHVCQNEQGQLGVSPGDCWGSEERGWRWAGSLGSGLCFQART